MKFTCWFFPVLLLAANHVEHWLNGNRVVAYDAASPDWQKKKVDAKWEDEKGYGMSKKSHIYLPDHSSEVWFRNVIKVL